MFFSPFLHLLAIFLSSFSLPSYQKGFEKSNPILPKFLMSKSKNESGIPFIYFSHFSYELDGEDHLSFSYLKAASFSMLEPNSTNSPQATTAS